MTSLFSLSLGRVETGLGHTTASLDQDGGGGQKY